MKNIILNFFWQFEHLEEKCEKNLSKCQWKILSTKNSILIQNIYNWSCLILLNEELGKKIPSFALDMKIKCLKLDFSNRPFSKTRKNIWVFTQLGCLWEDIFKGKTVHPPLLNTAQIFSVKFYIYRIYSGKHPRCCTSKIMVFSGGGRLSNQPPQDLSNWEDLYDWHTY